MPQDFKDFFYKHTNKMAAACWANTKIVKTEVFTNRGLWRIHINITYPINVKEINLVKKELLEKFYFLNDIEIVPLISKSEVLRDLVLQNKDELSYLLFSNSKIASLVEWKVNDLRVDLVTEDKKTYLYLIENDICNKLASWVEDNYSLRVIVRAIPSANQIVNQNTTSFISHKKPDIIVNESYQVNKFSEPNNNYRRAQNKRSKAASITPDSKTIAISDVQEGMRTAIVMGEIWHKEINSLRDGRFVVSYYLTDYQDTILIKSFLDKLADDTINIGDWLKVEGSVRYDNYAG